MAMGVEKVYTRGTEGEGERARPWIDVDTLVKLIFVAWCRSLRKKSSSGPVPNRGQQPEAWEFHYTLASFLYILAHC